MTHSRSVAVISIDIRLLNACDACTLPCVRIASRTRCAELEELRGRSEQLGALCAAPRLRRCPALRRATTSRTPLGLRRQSLPADLHHTAGFASRLRIARGAI